MTNKILSLCIVVFLLLAGCAPATSINTAQVPASNSSSAQTISLVSSSADGQQPVNIQQSNTSASSQPATEDSHTNDANESHTHAETDVTHLPIGDGHVSTQPEVGSVWSCQTSFNGRGAFNTGAWFNGDGTFDLTAKPVIDGSVTWPSSFTLTLQGDSRVFTGNDLPDHPTGNYPVSQNDDAYSYDRNPNSIRSQNLSFSLPANPTLAAQPQCVPGGPVGILLTGSYIFNALDGEGRDAVAHELQDSCQGHPEMQGAYHYHNLSTCIDDTPDANGNSPLVGYALDGFGIYGPMENGQMLTNADLDACHGRTSEVEWDGQRVNMYHYVATAEYPYTIGCYRGTSVRVGGGGPGNGNGQPGQNGNQPGPQNGQQGGFQQNGNQPGPQNGQQGGFQQNGNQPAPQNGQQGFQQNGQQGPQIDLAAAAAQLGVTEDALRAALGNPGQGRPNLRTAAAQLGVTVEQLIAALGLPSGPGGPPPGNNP